MEVRLVTAEVSLEPDVPGEVLVDVVNTDDVIDAVHVDVTGVPGAVVQLDATPTLFPGERRRLPLRVRLPAQVPAGRHRMDVLVSSSADQQQRPAGLIVEVRPKPFLAAAVRPSIRRARRRTAFPVTVANRGNTPLLIQVLELDLPNGVTLTFDPDQATLEPWQTQVCTVAVVAPRHLVGAIREHVLDLRVTAWSSTPGHPLMDQELSQDVRLTFRQRAQIGTGLLLGLVLILALAIWGTLGYLGLRKFVHSGAAPLAAAAGFFPGSAQPGRSDATITISGQVASEVDGSLVAGVTVLACSQDPALLRAKGCRPTTATAETLSDSNGRFWLPGLFPGPYQLQFRPAEAGPATLSTSWYDYSCSLTQRVPSRPGTLRLLVVQDPAVSPAAGTGTQTPIVSDVLVKVEARVAAPVPASATPSSASVPESAGTPAPTPTSTPTATRVCAHASAPGAAPSDSAGPVATATSGAAPAPPPTTAGPGPNDVVVGPRSVEQSAKPGRDGSFTSKLTLKDLPAPGRYDLTIMAGTSCATLPAVVVAPGENPAVLRVPLLAPGSAAGTCAP